MKKTIKPAVIETVNGRKFRLFKTKMRDFGYNTPHWALRKNIKEVFVNGRKYTVYVPYGRGSSSAYYSQPATFYGHSKKITIGCMYFKGRNFDLLRKWALEQ